MKMVLSAELMFRKVIRLKDGSEILLEQLTGKESAKELRDYINSFVKERVFLMFDKPISLAEEKKWLADEARANMQGKRIYLKAIADGKLVGSCTVRRGLHKERGNADIGIAMRKKWRGKGLGRIMLLEIIRLARRKWKPKNIWLSAFGMNNRARMLYESAGFRVIARLPEWINHYGKYGDKIILLLKK